MTRQWESIHPVTGEHLSHVAPDELRPLQDDPGAEPLSAFDAIFGRDVTERAGRCFDELTKDTGRSKQYSESWRSACAGNIAFDPPADRTRSRSG